MSADGKDRVPKPGNVSICAKCNSLAVFEDTGLRVPTEEEMLEFLSDSNVRKALAQKATTDQLFERIMKK
jgi:hypothetical protein